MAERPCRVAAIVQARMTSSRLPGKVLADLDGRPVLRFMLDRVKQAATLDAVVVATTVNATDDPVAKVARDACAQVFRGDEQDVLSRFVGAAEMVGADIVVRLTADCPFADPGIVDLAVRRFLESDADYLSNVVERSFPDGLDTEVMSSAALRRADREARQPYEREHVTPYIYAGGAFKVAQFRHDVDLSHLRWTIDTREDLARVRAMIAGLPADAGWRTILDAAAPGRPAVRLRPACRGDAETLFRWANDPELRTINLATSEPIPWPTHAAWFAERLADPNSRVWIAEDQARRQLGQVRLQERDGFAEVSIYVVPERRRSGAALKMLELAASACAELWPGRRLRARIRRDNEASRRLFERAGFAPSCAFDTHVAMTRDPRARPDREAQLA